MKRFMLLSLLLASGTAVLAQATENEVMKVTMKYDKRAIVTEFLNLTKEQGETFWPIYQKYETERVSISERRVKLVSDYLYNYQNLTDNTSDQMVTESLQIQKLEMAVREKYYQLVRKNLNATIAGKFYQIEEAVQAMIRSEIYSGLPVLQTK